jgi:hypothetical protein
VVFGSTIGRTRCGNALLHRRLLTHVMILCERNPGIEMSKTHK